MISRQQFLQRLLAISATTAIPGFYSFSCSPKKETGSTGTAELPNDTILTFDLHCHPGQFFFKGIEGYSVDEAILKTVGEMNMGKLSGAFMSIVSDMMLLQRTETGIVPARTFNPGEAWADFQRQLSIIKEILPELKAKPGRKTEDISAETSDGVTLFVSVEGGDFIEDDIDNVNRSYDEGVRSIQLVHYAPNQVGDLQTNEPVHDGLSEIGKSIVVRMNELGMIIDVAHASFKTVQDIADLTSQPVILSHSILKMEGDRPIAARAISEEHANLVAGTGGLIGAWPSGFNKSFEEYIDNIKRLVDVVGIDHVGLGTDMDSNFKPVMDSYLQLPDWIQALRDKGFSESEVAKLAGGNAMRVLNAVIG